MRIPWKASHRHVLENGLKFRLFHYDLIKGTCVRVCVLVQVGWCTLQWRFGNGYFYMQNEMSPPLHKQVIP
jgi:hypothetical protein